MANFKVVISDPKTKKAYQKEMDQGASGILQKRIGEKLRGDSMGLTGYELQVTGGSDRQGFPMRKDIEGIARKKILITVGTGFRTKVRGKRKRKSIRGNTVSTNISQVNVKVIGYGSKPIEQLIGAVEKKEKLTDEEKKKKLLEEVAGKVEEKAPEKSASEKILEEKEAKEKTEKGDSAKEQAKEEKPAEEPAETGEQAKEERPAEEPEKKEEKKPEKEEKPAEPEKAEEKEKPKEKKK
jgi:small subunit ribosomal protein S6e